MAGVFAREIGEYLHDNEQEAVRAYSRSLEKYNPLWYLTMPNWGGDPDRTPNDENLYATPEFAWTNMMIHAYVFKEGFEKVKNYVDCPSRRADLFFIQSLVAVIESGAGAQAVPGQPADRLKAWPVLRHAGVIDRSDPAGTARWKSAEAPPPRARPRCRPCRVPA